MCGEANKVGSQYFNLLDCVLIEAEIHFRLLFMEIKKMAECRRVRWKKNSLCHLKI